MISKIESLIKEVYIANVKKKEAEFKAFQAQINPHFLYNTLESVNSLAKIKGERDISNIIIALSRFLRISINKGNEFLTIREEIEHVKYYLEILERRYEDKFSVDFEINNEILKFKMIKLIIQPIVENAIYHGLELKEGKGYIKISGDIQDGNIIFIIKDNGIGMYQEQLQKINDALELGESKDNTIYGILNVNERIRLNFGEGYGLVYESVRNIGTSVKVMLPILKGDEEQDVQSFNC